LILEVVVERRSSVFVRPVTMDEGRRLQRISRTAKDPVRLRRAIVVLMPAQGRTVKDITSLMQVGEDYVRDVIHTFNERGFDALDPKSPPTSAGATPAPNPRPTSRPTHRSASGPNTRPRQRDKPLEIFNGAGYVGA
jgi:hypothetical protein